VKLVLLVYMTYLNLILIVTECVFHTGCYRFEMSEQYIILGVFDCCIVLCILCWVAVEMLEQSKQCESISPLYKEK